MVATIDSKLYRKQYLPHNSLLIEVYFFVHLLIIYLHKFIYVSLEAIVDSIENPESFKCNQKM